MRTCALQWIEVSIHAPLRREERRRSSPFQMAKADVSIHAPLRREERPTEGIEPTP